MKKYLILLLVLLSFNVSCQNLIPETAQDTTKTIFIDPSLVPLINNFIEEGAKRNCDVTPNLEEMEFIGYGWTMYYPMLGAATLDHKEIWLNPHLKMDTLALKAVLFHELGHAVLLKGHCDDEGDCDRSDLMHSVTPPTFAIYADDAFWKKELDKLFK